MDARIWLLCSSVLAWIWIGRLAISDDLKLLQDDAPLSRIAFGSCANESAPQPIWGEVLNFDPQLFIWLGDNIYADRKRPAQLTGKERTYGLWKNAPRFWQASPDEMERKYFQAKNQPGYVELRKKAQVIGTWDDHDYGLDDSGKELSGKDISQKLLLDFLDEPVGSPRRSQEGVYASYTFGPSGKQIKAILLDTRYHRDPIFSDGDMLGEKQWAWLEQQLRGSEAQITIIGSSIQVLANFSATVQPLFYVESWSHFPKERSRLFNLISETNVSGLFFLSGDVHFCEITRYDCGVGYPLYEITSSGLTHAVESTVSPLWSFLIRFAAWITPTTMRVYNSNCRYRSCAYGKENFGTIVVDWDVEPVSITLELRDINGSRVAGTRMLLSQLQAGSSNIKGHPTDLIRHCTLEVDLPWLSKHFLAMFLAMVFMAALCVISLIFLSCLYCLGTLMRNAVKPKLA